jgi:hypothetical protein
VLAAFTEISDHHRTDDGALALARSPDNGRTWDAKKVVAEEPGTSCFCNHGLTRLSDCTFLLHVVRGKHRNTDGGSNRFIARGSFARSVDNGRTWQDWSAVMDYPFLSPAGRGFSYGKVLELADGRLMVPFYGVPREAADPRRRIAAAVFSHDRGASWPDYSIIYKDTEGKIDPSETDFLFLPDGRYLAIMRSNAARLLFRSYSEDGGRTWMAPEATCLPGQCPALIYLESGDILCAYRDLRPDYVGVSCALSRDAGSTWAPLGSLYVGDNTDCAYPSLVRLENGELYCVFYTAAHPAPVYGTCEIHGLVLKDRSR